MFNMEHNEAQTTESGEARDIPISTVVHCADELHVLPGALLAFVLGEHA